jgi:probable F420-dependent oxidoreductase
MPEEIAVATNSKYWVQFPPMPADDVIRKVKDCEARGIEGVWTPQTYGAPFGPLSAAATVSSSLKLGAGIALAFVRSPFETACNAMDLDLVSNGRCVLGLGSSSAEHIEKRYGAHFGKGIRHMRELVGIVRQIIAHGHEGTLGKIEGEYYNMNFTGFRTLKPPLRTQIPIFLPGIFELACSLAAEIGDGLIGHPLWTNRWIEEIVEPSVQQGLAKSGRERNNFEVHVAPFVMITENREEAIEDARATMAQYSQTAHYNRYFDFLGFGEEARAVQAAQLRGDFAGMVAACSDAMVESIIVVGAPDEVAKEVALRSRFASGSMPKIAHVGLSAEKHAMYTQRLTDLFYP